MTAPAVGVRAADTPAGPIMFGHFAVFDTTEINSQYDGRFLETFAPGAFERTLAERTPKVLFQHGRDPQIGDKPLGRATVVREDTEGGFFEVALFPSVPGLLVDGLRDGAYGASFRFSTVREDVIERPGVSPANPDGIPERTIREARVMEFGPVTWPAYEGATAGIRSLAEEVGAEYRDGMRDPAAVLAMLKGTRMVTPVRSLKVGGETLRPGITRLRVDHELVREQPHRFRPADPADTATRSRLAALGGRTTTRHSRGVLPPRPPRAPWRLPRGNGSGVLPPPSGSPSRVLP